MTFDGIAYGPEEHLLLTFDGNALLAHDAQTEAPKWALTFTQPLVAVLYVDADTFPSAQSASPWRSSAATRWVVAVDDEGHVHVIDAGTGQEASTLGPFGRPVTVASGAGGRFALATAERVHIWRNGERTELPDRASCLAFSIDGGTLAVGRGDGALRLLSVAGAAVPVETFCAVVHGGVNDVVQHNGGGWLVAGRAGTFSVTDAGPVRLPQLPANVLRLRVDPRGGRIAAQLSERAVAVYAWPSLEVDTRIEYIERSVRGIAFGPANWLGVGLDHGDGNKIDVVTSSTHRTDTHPGRQHRSWMLSVRGRESVLSAREAEDIRRMKDPFHAPAPPKGNPNAGRIGFGAAVSLGLLVLRMCALGTRSTPSYSYTPPPNFGGLGLGSGSTTPTCDIACAKTRVGFLQVRCASDESCVNATGETLAALKANDCRRAKSAFAKITTFGATTGSAAGSDPLDVATFSLARTGLESACGATGNLGNLSSKHAMLVRLEGPSMTVTTEDVPRENELMGESAARVLVAPDGTVFVSTIDDTRTSSYVYRRDPDSEQWSTLMRRRSTRPVELQGTGVSAGKPGATHGKDLTIMDGDSLGHWDGSTKDEIKAPSSTTFALGAIGDDLFVVGSAPSKDDDDSAYVRPHALYRRHGTSDWKVEPVMAGVALDELWSGGTTVWATGTSTNAAGDSEQRLLQRVSGRWLERKWWGNAKHPDDDVVEAVWVSPTNDAFVAAGGGVYRSIGGGASFTKTNASAVDDVRSLWGRSASDVYAATPRGLLHYDGKTWSKTTYTQDAVAVSGTATDVLVVVTSK